MSGLIKKVLYNRIKAWNNSGSTPNTNVNTLNIANKACKDLSYITCFNYIKKDHYAIKCSKQKKKLVTVLTSSTLMIGAPCYPGTRFLYLISSSSSKIWRKNYDNFDGQYSHNSQNGHNGYN